MILSDLVGYMRQRGSASQSDMALHFGISQPALQGMLDLLERKGKIQPLAQPSCSSSCGSCSEKPSCGSQTWQAF